MQEESFLAIRFLLTFPRGAMYELFILSKLLHRPMHGYLIQALINSALGPIRRVSWGTLYLLIRKLQESGDIVAIGAGGIDPRGRKLCRATEGGRNRFLGLVQLKHGIGARLKSASFCTLIDNVARLMKDSLITVFDNA
jgi:DNA-binding PadR family transcriptional regulator